MSFMELLEEKGDASSCFSYHVVMPAHPLEIEQVGRWRVCQQKDEQRKEQSSFFNGSPGNPAPQLA